MATPYLSHLFLEVADLDRARWFWVEALGLVLLQDRGDYLQVGDPAGHGFQIGIERKPESAVEPSDYPEITLRVPDCDAAARHLEGLGVTIEDGPADQPWGARPAWFRDPDGRRMSVYSSDEPIMETQT
jgi:catechol 2,3-dioxygenase-like lactoylglutathione lyase family enzyme